MEPESLFIPGTTRFAKPPTNREALNVARNALHTLVFSPDMGGNCLEAEGKTAREPGSDHRYALALLDRLLADPIVLDAIKGGEPATWGRYERYLSGLKEGEA